MPLFESYGTAPASHIVARITDREWATQWFGHTNPDPVTIAGVRYDVAELCCWEISFVTDYPVLERCVTGHWRSTPWEWPPLHDLTELIEECSDAV